MADTPSIPPSSASSSSKTLSAGISGGKSVSPVSPAKAPDLTNLMIRQAAVTLKTGNAEVTLKGIVVAVNPQLEEITVKTARGEITVKSDAKIPLDSEVSIKLYRNNAQAMADIRILKQEQSMTEEIARIASPPPPIKEGDALQAILLPEVETAEIKEVINIIQNISKEELTKSELNLSQELIKKINAAPNIKDLVEQLPPKEQKEFIKAVITEFLTPHKTPINPDSMHKMQEAYKPHSTAPAAQAPASYEVKTSDNDLIKLIHHEIKTSAAENIMQEQSSSMPMPENETAKTKTAANIVKTALPLIPLETIEHEQETAPSVKAEYTHENKASEKHYKIDILKILPAENSSAEIKDIINKENAKIPQTLGDRQKNAILTAKLESVTQESLPILKATDTVSGATEHFIIKKPATVAADNTIIIKISPLGGEQVNETSFNKEVSATLPLAGKENFEPFINTKWPALEKSLQILTETVPQTAETVKASLPTPSKALAPTALFFLAALRFGSIEGWLGGSTLKALRDAGQKDLLEKLSGDFSRLSTQSKEPIADDWKAVSMPLIYDEQLEQIQLFTRQHREEDKESGKEYKISRFILNLNLSRMGKMQLDGFIKSKQFDLTLRSEEKLPFEIRQEIMQRFASGLEQINMRGAISFQIKKDHWIDIALPHSEGLSA